MKKAYSVLIILCCLVLLKSTLHAQSLPVGTPVLDDYYRRMQLLGKVDSTLSFTLRPNTPNGILNDNDAYDPDSTLKRDHWVKAGPIYFAKGYGKFQILPIAWQQQYNSDHPYGWNDGPIIPAKGYQTMVSGGVYIKYGPLSVQFRPEYVYAANQSFKGYDYTHIDQDLSNYYATHNLIEWPEQFGKGAYHKFFLGQSNIMLTFGPVAFGISNENLWWGPGISNSLILTNNAPGFRHLTLNTTKPIKTAVGYFEAQIIAARLDNVNIPPLLTTALPDGTQLYVPKRDDWRYFTGVNINYHPKWVPGLTLGFTRTFNSYYADVKKLGDYLPFFLPYQKEDTNGDPIDRDQQTSLYSRWLFPKAMAEIYVEYGLTDNSYNFRDFTGSPDHSRAYVFGFRKMLPIKGVINQHIVISSEITQISQSPDRFVRFSGLWYVHYQVKQGDTNQGQILGAGTGPGGNLQTIDVSWVSGLKKLGLRFERYEHDVDFSDIYFPDVNGNSRKWVDFAAALQGEWNYKNLIFNAKLQEVKSFNYEWVLKDFNTTNYYIPHNDVYNFHGELGVTFRF